MINRIKDLATYAQAVWTWIQGFVSVQGGIYVDMFAVVFIVRLLAPLKGFPALNYSEAGMWAATISAYAYSKGGPKQS